MQAVQTRTDFVLLPEAARTRFRLGFQRRRRVLFAWLTTLPYWGPLPQSSHFIAISCSCTTKIDCLKALHCSRLADHHKALFVGPFAFGERAFSSPYKPATRIVFRAAGQLPNRPPHRHHRFMDLSHIKALIFDLDGTLIDSERDLIEATNAMLRELDRPKLPSATISGYIGHGAAKLVASALGTYANPPQQVNALQIFLRHYEAHKLDCTR